MWLRFDAHAQQRMTERGITEDEVMAVMANPLLVFPSTHPDARGEREARVAVVDGRRLQVIATKTDPPWIVTVFEVQD
jgi:hypothetical protein